jgi:hypothetical protein
LQQLRVVDVLVLIGVKQVCIFKATTVGHARERVFLSTVWSRRIGGVTSAPWGRAIGFRLRDEGLVFWFASPSTSPSTSTTATTATTTASATTCGVWGIEVVHSKPKLRQQSRKGYVNLSLANVEVSHSKPFAQIDVEIKLPFTSTKLLAVEPKAVSLYLPLCLQTSAIKVNHLTAALVLVLDLLGAKIDLCRADYCLKVQRLLELNCLIFYATNLNSELLGSNSKLLHPSGRLFEQAVAAKLNFCFLTSLLKVKRTTRKLSFLLESASSDVDLSNVTSLLEVEAAISLHNTNSLKLKLRLGNAKSLKPCCSLFVKAASKLRLFLAKRRVELLLPCFDFSLELFPLSNVASFLQVERTTLKLSFLLELLGSKVKLSAAETELTSGLSCGESLRSSSLELALLHKGRLQSLLELLGLGNSVSLKFRQVLGAGKLREVNSSLHGGKAILSLRLSRLL